MKSSDLFTFLFVADTNVPFIRIYLAFLFLVRDCEIVSNVIP